MSTEQTKTKPRTSQVTTCSLKSNSTQKRILFTSLTSKLSKSRSRIVFDSKAPHTEIFISSAQRHGLSVKMEEFGALSKGLSKFLKPMYVHKCVRYPGFVYEFQYYGDRKYQCCTCKTFGKSRCITVVNDTLVSGTKHPEDDHHEKCQPIPETAMQAHNAVVLSIYRVCRCNLF